MELVLGATDDATDRDDRWAIYDLIAGSDPDAAHTGFLEAVRALADPFSQAVSDCDEAWLVAPIPNAKLRTFACAEQFDAFMQLLEIFGAEKFNDVRVRILSPGGGGVLTAKNPAALRDAVIKTGTFRGAEDEVPHGTVVYAIEAFKVPGSQQATEGRGDPPQDRGPAGPATAPDSSDSTSGDSDSGSSTSTGSGSSTDDNAPDGAQSSESSPSDEEGAASPDGVLRVSIEPAICLQHRLVTNGMILFACFDAMLPHHRSTDTSARQVVRAPEWDIIDEDFAMF